VSGGNHHGGKRQGAGRPVTNPDRPLVLKRVNLFADQTRFNSKKIRQIIDDYVSTMEPFSINFDETVAKIE
jgi:hypothetical protein